MGSRSEGDSANGHLRIDGDRVDFWRKIGLAQLSSLHRTHPVDQTTGLFRFVQDYSTVTKTHRRGTER